MKFIISLIFLLMSLEAFTGTCTEVSRTAYTANQVLTSTALNADFDQFVTSNNAYDAGCITDGTLEDGALNTTDFAVPLKAIQNGCKVTRSDASTTTIDKCMLSVNGAWVNKTTATTAAFGCTSCSAEATGTVYYVYAKTGSTGSTLTPLILTTTPNNDGYDASGNKVLGRFYNDATGDIEAYSFDQWHTNNFVPSNTVWASYTPTFGGVGTATNINMFWRREGDSVHIRGYFQMGTVVAANVRVDIPTGLTIDTAKLPTSYPNILGEAFRLNATSGFFQSSYGFIVVSDGVTTTGVYITAAAANQTSVTLAKGSTLFANSDGLIIDALIPVKGWY